MKKIMDFLLVGFILLGLSSSVNATLIDRGNGLIYDDVLLITWLQNANLAATENFGVAGISSTGDMSWYTAQEWIAAMNTAEYLGFNDWRLPETLPINGSFYNDVNQYNGSKDNGGWNLSAPHSAYPGSTGSEMAYMYYNNLNGLARFDVNGDTSPKPDWGSPFGIHWGLENTGLFNNIRPIDYWSDTNQSFYGHTARAFTFYFYDGYQNGHDMISDYSKASWAVRDGDIGAPIPEPTTMFLFGLGILGIAAVSRKKQSNQTQ